MLIPAQKSEEGRTAPCRQPVIQMKQRLKAPSLVRKISSAFNRNHTFHKSLSSIRQLKNLHKNVIFPYNILILT
jgi:hypothetical protein